MATLSVAFMLVSDFRGTAVGNTEGSTTQSMTTSGTSQQSAAASSAKQVVRLAVVGGNVWIKIGSNPTASAGDQILLLDGSVEYFSISNGDRVAVVDAS